MKKKDVQNQLLFNTLLDEVDGMVKLDEKSSPPPIDEKKEIDARAQQSLAQEKIKEKRKELVKQRYTKYCIEWILGLHLKTATFPNHYPTPNTHLPASVPVPLALHQPKPTPLRTPPTTVTLRMKSPHALAYPSGLIDTFPSFLPCNSSALSAP